LGGALRLLLDTHALIWWWEDEDRLSPQLLERFRDPATTIVVSAVTAWEIATKQRIGKLPDFRRAAIALPNYLAEDGFELLSVSLDHAIRGGSYAAAHGDPFDRLLAAQSELESLPLVTRDPAFSAFPCETIW